MRSQFVILTLIVILSSCSKKNDTNVEKVNYSSFSGDTLKVSLGYFGDEEGATISQVPVHAELSRLVREINSGSIVYQYLPVYGFTGTEIVEIILNRGSDGASAGKKDKMVISIIVK